MTSTLPAPTVDRAIIETVLWRVATTAIAWGSDPADTTHPADNLRDAVAWCLASLEPDTATPLRVVVARSILDPTQHRHVLVAALQALTPDDRIAGLGPAEH